MTSYCKRCVYPVNAVALSLDDEGICSACRSHEDVEEFTVEQWEARKKKFELTIQELTKGNTSNYDCVIPVSGGKDSFYQTHKMVKEYGLKALLVTYHGNNYLPEGDYNRDLMRQVFDADHIVFGPGVETLKKLNRLCFKKMGDMNWHAHCGIVTYPIQVAVMHKIPMIIWGETLWDVAGMFDADDYPEFSVRMRHEHDLRGFEWYDMLNDDKEKLSEKDMIWAKYPSDDEILEVGVRGIYIGNYFKWEPYSHTKMVQEKYGWKTGDREFERTYRKMSNLDDRYKNGAHDLLKFIKFGYGRASDHASKDIRSGHMTREEGIEMVRKYDHVVSSDLDHWLKYVDMTETEFWETADTFRDPRVWWIKDGEWWKNNIWGEASSYGKVFLTKDRQTKYIR